jgi:hypothetical protein
MGEKGVEVSTTCGDPIFRRRGETQKSSFE